MSDDNGTKPDLSTVTLDELTDEIATRCDAVIIACLPRVPDEGETDAGIVMFTAGRALLGLGLLLHLDDHVRNENGLPPRREANKD